MPNPEIPKEQTSAGAYDALKNLRDAVIPAEAVKTLNKFVDALAVSRDQRLAMVKNMLLGNQAQNPNLPKLEATLALS
ncbi:MAG: hypothetical protein Greene041662_511 [Candidatus Peregrinibacteria bacterium Greene0416_62]|nr:MAG: hypothetical protein Greene041662_511 [Candidatus Peregrinibacteria bacterium Greene0416_62]TSC98127.1 MAG: hypothetical protein Greene101449_983 [Candidatus Peregrinibacteria bacterium Greene1014_49]